MHSRSFALLVLTGCATAGTFQTADTLGPGGWEAGGDLSALTIIDGGDTVTLPLPRGVVRFGLGERGELGGSLGLDGVRGYGKIQLTGPDSPLIVSVAPGVRWLPLPNGGDGSGALYGLEQALLAGVPVGEHTQIVVTARLTEDVGRVDQRTAFLMWAGGTAGVSFRLGDLVRLHPELGLMAPVVVVSDTTSVGPDALTVQAGLGLVFGRRPRPANSEGVPPDR